MPEISSLSYLALFSVPLFFFFGIRALRLSKSAPLPPGPKGWPLIGNLLDMPKKFEWKTYHQWSKEMGTDILYVNFAGTKLVILDTLEAATDLLEKRSGMYSGRARMPMITELMGWNFNFGLLDYGDDWRIRRRLMNQQFHAVASRQFRPHMLKSVRTLLNKFLETPEDVLENLRHMSAETIISIGYGLQVQPKDDPYVRRAEKATITLVEAGSPGRFLVDAIPILKYIPEWVPGAGFKKLAREWSLLAKAMVEAPLAAARKQIDDGTAIPSFISLNVENNNGGSTFTIDPAVRDVAATLYVAGSDSTAAGIALCILGLIKNPHVVKKAQEELDRVVKPGYLPDFEDQDSLPYITAIVKETLRWREIAPIGVPHLLKEDDMYKGYKLPAGTIVIANQWAMLHNEAVYPDPFTFNPDRFMKDEKLNPEVPDPELACWGFGRRICPGRHMAIQTLWIGIASLLTVFDIQKAVDAHGNIIEPCDDEVSSLVATPKPYKCSVTPRSKDAVRLIQSIEKQDILGVPQLTA